MQVQWDPVLKPGIVRHHKLDYVLPHAEARVNQLLVIAAAGPREPAAAAIFRPLSVKRPSLQRAPPLKWLLWVRDCQHRLAPTGRASVHCRCAIARLLTAADPVDPPRLIRAARRPP